MKKLVTLFIFFAFCSVSAQTGDDAETLKKINQSVIAAYQNKDFDEALKSARQALNISLKIFGAEDSETASAYTNLGVILREKKKYKDSVENLQNALDIYRKSPDKNGKNIATGYETLAFSHLLSGDAIKATEGYLQSLELTEKIYGKDSKESFPLVLSIANSYTYTGDFEKADEYYLKGYALAVKHFDKKGKEIEQIENLKSCLMPVPIGDKNKERAERFQEAKKTLLGTDFEDFGTAISGKAKYLAKPEYPQEARTRGAVGRVSVRVKIDEKGDVLEAKIVCGDPSLIKAAEDAAMKSKFTQTLSNGKPVKVTGIMVYTFSR